MSTSRHSSSTETLRAALPTHLLLAAVIALYGAADGNDVVYDDRVLILHNAALQSWSTPPEAPTRDLFHFSPSRLSLLATGHHLELLPGVRPGWRRSRLSPQQPACSLAERGGSQAAPRGELRGTPLALLWVCWPLQVEAAVNIAGRTDRFCPHWDLSLQQRRAWARGLSAFLAASKEVGLLWVAAAASGRPWRAQALGTASYLLCICSRSVA